MRKIDKSAGQIISTEYKSWVDAQDSENKVHSKSRTYYDDVVMNLYRCQLGVCAYTEMWICVPELYHEDKWVNGRYTLPEAVEEKRTDHMGQLEHFDSKDKVKRHWNWDNLFMVHATVNGQKSGIEVVSWLKPDLDDYEPDAYFDYDDETHRYLPNTDIEDADKKAKIMHMIDNVLRLNHGVIRKVRENYINELKDKIKRNQPINVNQFFTAVRFSGIDY